MTRVRFHLDFVSPYTYLALAQAESFAEKHSIQWELRPVVYGAILDATGLVGPVETTAKRAYTFRDVVRSAALLGIDMVGPPEHPFRSLAALRLLAAHQDQDSALSLARGLASACWGEGRDLTDAEVLQAVMDDLQLPGSASEIIADPDVKLVLRGNTSDALERGVFGVPTFGLNRELFWGHDRYTHLAAVLTGAVAPAGSEAAMLDRPRGADRSAAPGSGT